jgi:hypothetical protein
VKKKPMFAAVLVNTAFGHVLASDCAVGPVGTSLITAGPKNQGNSGSASVSG